MVVYQAAAPALTRVRIKRPSFFKFAQAGLLLALVVGVIFAAAIGTLINQSPLTYGVALAVILIIASFLLAWPWHRRTIAKVNRILSRNPGRDLGSSVQDVTQLLAWTETSRPIRELPEALVKQGRTGNTILAWRKKEPPPIQPLMEVFEPRLLDEADAAFDELALAADSEGEPSDPGAADSPAQREDLLGTRRIKRNIRLKGGWFVVVAFAFPTVIGAMESIGRGRVTWQFLLWSTLLLLLLFQPLRRGSFSAPSQWLLVPGGLLLRKAGVRGGKVNLHLFERNQSVLSAYQLRRGRWLLTVADAEGSETTLATDLEQRLLLRAWLSPRKPPPVEQLIDYT